MSKELRWFFGPAASQDQGPNNSVITTFRGDKYYSLAREVIQNSLDADDKSNARPVKVKFALTSVPTEQIPRLSELSEDIKRCANYYRDDTRFKEFCDNAIALLSASSISCLRISDYNTLGMAYGNEENKGPFYAFMRSVGYNHKEIRGAGGSFGYGKGAYFLPSQLRTVFVSSNYGHGQHVFQGKAMLTTHTDEQGNRREDCGLYGGDNGHPITVHEDIPELFRRTEKGTDFLILGFHQEPNWKDSLIKSILNNFWFAILENDLVAEVEDTTITLANLEEVIAKYYDEADLDGSVSDPQSWNPYPYYKAVKYNKGVSGEYVQQNLSTLGPCKLYFRLKDQLPKRIAYMRSPKMIVYKRGYNQGSGYAGVFVCDNDRGNEILRLMENPQHNEWRKNNYQVNDSPHPDAARAEEEIKKFVKDSLTKLMKVDGQQSQKVLGLEQYLSIPEDLLASEETKGASGSGSRGGKPSATLTEEETAVETTRKTNETPVIPITVRRQPQVPAVAVVTPDPKGNETNLSGLREEGGVIPDPGPNPGPPRPNPGRHPARIRR